MFLSLRQILTANYKRVIFCDSVLWSNINVYLEKVRTSQKMTRFFLMNFNLQQAHTNCSAEPSPWFYNLTF